MFKFLSTPSGWRATLKLVPMSATERDFYPRPPGGGRPCGALCVTNLVYFYPRPPGGGRLYTCPLLMCNHVISIHALRVEGDNLSLKQTKVSQLFLSTPSGWRATRAAAGLVGCALISIHALRVEGDHLKQSCCAAALKNFYPRPPGGGRHDVIIAFHPPKGISIHALRVEGDQTPRVRS